MGKDLPPSARNHRPFWANAVRNVYAKHWMSVGFKTSTRDLPTGHIQFFRFRKDPGFDRQSISTPKRSTRVSQVRSVPTPRAPSRPVDLVLLGCVKKKRSIASPAKDLYCSPLWEKRRHYAEASGVRWLILSAEHGLVGPNAMIEPYDKALKDMTAAERRSWAQKVDRELAEVVGELRGKSIEIHAGMDYQLYLRPLMEARGADVIYPLEGLTQGQQLQWYNQPSGDLSVAELTGELLNPERRILAGKIKSAGSSGLQMPGLYSWWADDSARELLGRSLGIEMGPLIYIGQAGATKWPSGKRSKATLWSRITSQHLNGRITTSTFRLTLTALLEGPLQLIVGDHDLEEASKQRLSAFIANHLCIAPVPVQNPDTLEDLEAQIVVDQDPPLNLTHVDQSVSSRQRLKALRGHITDQLND